MTTAFEALSDLELIHSMTFESAAERAYRAYAVSSGNKNFKGDMMPSWTDLPPPIRGHWRAAAAAIVMSL